MHEQVKATPSCLKTDGWSKDGLLGTYFCIDSPSLSNINLGFGQNCSLKKVENVDYARIALICPHSIKDSSCIIVCYSSICQWMCSLLRGHQISHIRGQNKP